MTAGPPIMLARERRCPGCVRVKDGASSCHVALLCSTCLSDPSGSLRLQSQLPRKIRNCLRFDATRGHCERRSGGIGSVEAVACLLGERGGVREVGTSHSRGGGRRGGDRRSPHSSLGSRKAGKSRAKLSRMGALFVR